jgi:quercetin dioxygenase-like cupin family protein
MRDEYTYVIEGEVGFEVGGEEFTARPGTLVLKPRGVPHVFWNATDRPAKVLEIIAPAGFEKFFEEMLALRRNGQPPSPEEMQAVWERWGQTMDFPGSLEA